MSQDAQVQYHALDNEHPSPISHLLCILLYVTSGARFVITFSSVTVRRFGGAVPLFLRWRVSFWKSLRLHVASVKVVDDADCICDIVLMNPPWGQQRRSADRPFLQVSVGSGHILPCLRRHASWQASIALAKTSVHVMHSRRLGLRLPTEAALIALPSPGHLNRMCACLLRCWCSPHRAMGTGPCVAGGQMALGPVGSSQPHNRLPYIP